MYFLWEAFDNILPFSSSLSGTARNISRLYDEAADVNISSFSYNVSFVMFLHNDLLYSVATPVVFEAASVCSFSISM